MAGPYHVESFTETEAARLRPFVSNLDSPVFVLRGLPQVTAAALFARYSRTAKSLRRLLLDEFLVGELAITVDPDDAGRERAGDLFGRVLAEYGDDSVAQLGGVHVACEQVSQPLAKAIEWGRLAAYLEQSTRYIAYSDRRDGWYRYHRDPEVMASPHRDGYVAAMDGLFDAYTELFDPLRDHLDRSLPGEGDAGARRRAIRALALDLLRGLLPAGTVSNLGVFASPQAFEQMVMRLRAHPLPEARSYAELIATELRATVPEFVGRLDRPDRGGTWVEYLHDTQEAVAEAAARVLPREAPEREARVRLLRFDVDGEDRIIAGALQPHGAVSLETALRAVAGLGEAEKDELFATIVGVRGNRRHRPGRGFEHTGYTFEVISDFGAFRDLQRHRLLTVQWQRLTPAHGYRIPDEVEELGMSPRWRAAVERAEEAYEAVGADLPEQAAYLVTLGHRLRYTMSMNAREALHVIELRTAPQGHPSYRRICREMLRLIDVEAGHHRLAAAMQFAGSEDVHLPRYAAEVQRAT
jgi:thymidylate synthase ThyX